MILVMIRYLWPSSDTKVQGAATGGIGDSFVLFPRILWCWVSFARAFLLGRLVSCNCNSEALIAAASIE